MILRKNKKNRNIDCDKEINDNGITVIVSLLLLLYRKKINKNLLLYLSSAIVFSNYKGLSVFNPKKNFFGKINMSYLFNTCTLNKNFDKKFRIFKKIFFFVKEPVKKLLEDNGNIQKIWDSCSKEDVITVNNINECSGIDKDKTEVTDLVNYINEKENNQLNKSEFDEYNRLNRTGYVFIYNDYTDYLDWFTGAFEHLALGLLINKSIKNKKFKEASTLLKIEGIYEIINYANTVVEFIANKSSDTYEKEDLVAFIFNSVHAISIFAAVFLSEKNVKNTQKPISTFVKTFLNSPSYIVTYSTVVSYIITNLKSKKVKNIDTIKDGFVYSTMLALYVIYFKDIGKIKLIKQSNGSKITKSFLYFTVIGVYLYIAYPAVRLVV